MAEIRPLTADDWELARDLRLAALRDAPEAFGGTLQASVERTEQEWRVWPLAGQVFAAFHEGRPAGLACGVPSRPEEPGIDFLISMWVSPEARGGKVGAALIDAVAQWARSRGRKVLRLHVFEANQAAYRAYLKAGFTPIGPSEHYPGTTEMELPL